MVNVPNGRVAIRRPAGVVPGFDQSPEPASKEPGLGVRGKEFSRARRCVEPAKPNGELRTPALPVLACSAPVLSVGD